LGGITRMAETRQDRWSALRILLGILAALFLLVQCFPVLLHLLAAWPPDFIERRTQRQQVFERIQSSGGWQSLQADCVSLIAQNRGTNFFWSRPQTNLLPASIAALNPREVRFIDSRPEVVHIKVFGYRNTDGHQQPYFGLQVVSGAGADSYRPKDMAFEIITNNIYAVYE
jgi:hypothetical protein